MPLISQFALYPSLCTFNIQYNCSFIIISITSLTLSIHSDFIFPSSSIKCIHVTGKRIVLKPYFFIFLIISFVGAILPFNPICSSGAFISIKILKLSKVLAILYPIPILFTISKEFPVFISCDKEIEDKTSLTNFYLTNADKYIPKLLNILKTYPKFKLNNESWNISRAVCYIISFIVNSSTDETILTNLLNYSSKYFNSISYEEKINSFLILSCCLESKNLKIIYDALQPEILNLIKKINDNNSIYSYTVSWILGKISETIPFIFEQDKFYEIISTLINIINNKSDNIQFKFSNEIRINICIVF